MELDEKINEHFDMFLTTTQAAKYLNISMATLKKIIIQGKIKAFKTPGGHYRIRKADLLETLYT